jgi:hypothetical protein
MLLCPRAAERKKKKRNGKKRKKSFCRIFLFQSLNWVRCIPPLPPRGRGRMGVGVSACPQYGTRIRDWVPLSAAIAICDRRLGISGRRPDLMGPERFKHAGLSSLDTLINKSYPPVLFGEIEGKSLAPQSWRKGSRGPKVERQRSRDETPSRSLVSQKSRKAPREGQ